MNLFRAARAATVNIDVSSSSQRVAITSQTGPIQIRVMNNGSATVWINFGDSTATAALASGIPIGPGISCGFTESAPDGGALYVAAIAAGATGKIYFTPGGGL